MPDKATVFRWIACHKEFRVQYGWAREFQADELIAEILEIADGRTSVWVEKMGPDGKAVMVLGREDINSRCLRVNTRLKHLARMAPRKYGRS
jgi:hypothetical protein